MAFKEVQDLDADTTIALGGVNKKTGKPNPNRVEGYLIGTRIVESKKSKDGTCKLHIFETDKGKLGVWGKTDLDRKLANAPVGAMIRATCTGMQAIPGKNDMYKYKVEVDTDNTIEVNTNTNVGPPASDDTGNYADPGVDEESGLDDDEAAFDEVTPSRPKAPARPVEAAAARANRVQALLNSRKTS